MEREVIGELTRSLSLPKRRRAAIARELQAHLTEAQRELELAGWSPDEATRESVRRLGDPAEISEAFNATHRRSRRTRIGLAFGLAGALLVGAYGASGTFASASSVHGHTMVKHSTVIHSQHHRCRATPTR